MSFWVAGAAVVAGVGGAVISSSAQKKSTQAAINAQTQSQADALAAQRQAPYDQLASLPIQRGIASAAARGTNYTYTNPVTGETQTANFAGDTDWAAYAKTPEVAAHIQRAKDTNYGYKNDIEAAQDYYNNYGKDHGDVLPATGGLSDYDLSRLQAESDSKLADFNAQQQLDLQKKYGNQFTDQAIEQLKRTDPEGYALRKQFGGDLNSGANSQEALARQNPGVPTYERAGNGPQYNEISQIPQTFKEGANLSPLERANDANLPQFQRGSDAAGTAAIRGGLETDAQNQIASIGTLDPALQRAAEQSARARGASSGNLLGNGAALKEAQSVQLAQIGQDQQKRQNALGLLTSGQTTTDANTRLRGENNSYTQQEYGNQIANMGQRNQANMTEFDAAQQANALTNQARSASTTDELSRINQANTTRDQSYQNAMAAISQRNQATQSEYGAKLASTQAIQGARQQDTANKQSFLGLTPIASQGGALASLQQGAAPFQYQPVQGAQYNASLAAQQGIANGNNIAAAGRNTTNILANQTSPWATMLGSLSGSATGSVGGTFGNIAANRLANYFNPPKTAVVTTPSTGYNYAGDSVNVRGGYG